MFSIIRTIVGCIFFVCSITIIKKSNVVRKRLLCMIFAGISITAIVLLNFFPIENLFLSFDTPKAAYEYYILGESNIELVVEGDKCDFVVDRQRKRDSHLIIPKTTGGWKIGIGADTKRVAQKISDEKVLYVYQYKNTSDYFITILDTKVGQAVVSDDYNTEFFSLERTDSLGQIYFTYYAYIPNFNPQYSVTINGNQIVFE